VAAGDPESHHLAPLSVSVRPAQWDSSRGAPQLDSPHEPSLAMLWSRGREGYMLVAAGGLGIVGILVVVVIVLVIIWFVRRA
jgi:hypothetical protein